MKINVVPFFICETKNGIDISEDYSLVVNIYFYLQNVATYAISKNAIR